MSEETTADRVRRAVDQLERRMTRDAPYVAESALPWMAGENPGARPEDRLLHPRFFPIFDLPCWAEIAACGRVDPRLQSDLVYSTLNGYFFSRLIDDVMDGHDARARAALSATAFFHAEFQRPYLERFGSGDPFWGVFHDAWFGAHEAAHRDAAHDQVDRRTFEEVSARKLSAVKIPVAGALHLRGRADLLDVWSPFLDRLGRVHQMADDLADFRDDLDAGRATYLLTEGAARKRPDESVAQWFVREGFSWAVDVLEGWAVELADAANLLGSPEACLYVSRREATLRRQFEEMIPALRALAVVAAGMRGSGERG